MKKKNIIDKLILEHPEVKNFKRGFPNIGKRNDNSPFGEVVSEIEKAWHFYDTDLYNIETCDNIIKLGSGNPLNYKSFPGAIKYLKKELKKSLYEYPPAAGDEKHRQIISEYLIDEGFPKYLNYNNIITTNSTTQAFYLIIKSMCRPYDVIIMTSPNYGLFTFMPERVNVSVETIKLRKEDNYLIDTDELNKRILEINKNLEKEYKGKLDYIPRVRAFLNINPHNPLGIVLSNKNIILLDQIGKVCSDNDVFIIDDLIYRDLSYDRNNLAKAIGTIDKYFNNTISLFGLSKSYGLARTRSGFIVANEVVIRLLRDNLFYMMDSASVLQSALLAGTFNSSKLRKKEYKKYFNKIIPKYIFNCYLAIALFNGIDYINNTRYYSDIFDLLRRKFKNDKLKYILEGVPYAKVVITPESGFFLLVDFTKIKDSGIISSEKELLEFIYRKCGIKFLVGQSISWPNKNEIIIRITYSFDKDTIVEAISKINLAIRRELYEADRSNNLC